MKPLHKLFNIDKAKILHDLIPSEIPSLLSFMTERHNKLIEAKDEITDWNNWLISLDQWVKLANAVQKSIDQYGKRLEKSASLFRDQLFDGYAAIWSNDCVIQYAESGLCRDKDFMNAVALLYGIDKTKSLHIRYEQLQIDISQEIQRVAERLVNKFPEGVALINASESEIRIGDYDPNLNGYPALNEICITGSEVKIRLEDDVEFVSLDEYDGSLSIADKLELLTFLDGELKK
jgi:hypothetical protein